jgi:hypothetical protein
MLATQDANLPALSKGPEALNETSVRLAGMARHPAADNELDRLLRGSYTMASERQIHEAFIGRLDSISSLSATESRDDFLL